MSSSVRDLETVMLVELLRRSVPGSAPAGDGSRREPTGTVDWADFGRRVRYHQVVPLVSEQLRHESPAVPPQVIAELAAASELNARLVLRQTAQMLDLVTSLASESIPTIVLKGPVLALRAYGNLALRQHGDVDLLVRAEQVEAAIRLLLRDGYDLALQYTGEHRSVAAFRELAQALRQGRAVPASDARVARRWRTFLELGNELTFYNPELGVVDVHWKPFRNSAYFRADPWTHRTEFSMNGVEIGVLTPELELIYLIAHGAGHGWAHLKWLVDVPHLLARARPDLEAVAVLAADAGLVSLVGAALRLCAALFGSPDTGFVAELFPEDRRTRALVTSSLVRLTSAPRAEDAAHQHAFELWQQLRLAGSAAFRLRAIEDAFAPANWWLDMAAVPGARPARVVRCVASSALQRRHQAGARDGG